jgi:hypothetical protein
MIFGDDEPENAWQADDPIVEQLVVMHRRLANREAEARAGYPIRARLGADLLDLASVWARAR